MKKIYAGIIALIIPLSLFAQTAKEAQDLEQVRQKVTRIEKDNLRLKQQVSGVQKSVAKMNEAEAVEHLDLATHDSIAKAARDTVISYSGRLLTIEQNITELRLSLNLQCIGLIVFVILLVIVIALRWWMHHKTHHKDQEELLDKMRAQREEREQRISELRAMIEKSETGLLEKMKAQREEREKRITEIRNSIEQSQNELSGMKKETGDRLTAVNDNIAHVDKNLQTLLAEKSNNLEQQIKEGLARVKKENEEGSKEFLKKVENVQSLINSVSSKISEMGQKVADLGKKS